MYKGESTCEYAYPELTKNLPSLHLKDPRSATWPVCLKACGVVSNKCKYELGYVEIHVCLMYGYIGTLTQLLSHFSLSLSAEPFEPKLTRKTSFYSVVLDGYFNCLLSTVYVPHAYTRFYLDKRSIDDAWCYSSCQVGLAPIMCLLHGVVSSELIQRLQKSLHDGHENLGTLHPKGSASTAITCCCEHVGVWFSIRPQHRNFFLARIIYISSALSDVAMRSRELHGV